MDKYICTRCGRILNQFEYENYVCLCIECHNGVKGEFEDDEEIYEGYNNIDIILENRRSGIFE